MKVKKLLLNFLFTCSILGVYCVDASFIDFEGSYHWSSSKVKVFDNTEKHPTFFVPDSVSFNVFGFRLTMLLSEEDNELFLKENADFEYSGFSIEIESRIKKISINTLNNFNQNHPAGSDVTNLFRGMFKETKDFYIKIDNLVQYAEDNKLYNYESSQILKDLDHHPYSNIDFVLNEQNFHPSNHAFIVTLTTEKGIVFSDTSEIKYVY